MISCSRVHWLLQVPFPEVFSLTPCGSYLTYSRAATEVVRATFRDSRKCLEALQVRSTLDEASRTLEIGLGYSKAAVLRDPALSTTHVACSALRLDQLRLVEGGRGRFRIDLSYTYVVS
nr:hypothetical protein CFP56_13334 [Quercus suber]